MDHANCLIMCQHSWYDPNRRHYGRKPNTRKERGLKRIDYGIKKGPATKKRIESLAPVEPDMNVKEVAIPRSMAVVKRYIKIYNWYVQHYDKFNDKDLCIAETAKKFSKSIMTIKKAIAVCKYILATTEE